MYYPSKGLHIRCVTIGCQLDTATASARFFTLHSSLFTFHSQEKAPVSAALPADISKKHRRKKSKKLSTAPSQFQLFALLFYQINAPDGK